MDTLLVGGASQQQQCRGNAGPFSASSWRTRVSLTGNRRHRQLVLAIEFFSKSGRSGGRAKALDGLGWVAAAILLAGALFTVARLP